MKKLMHILLFLLVIIVAGCTIGPLSKDNTSTGMQYSLDDLQKNIVQHGSSDLEKTYAESKAIKDLYVLIDYLVASAQYDKAASYFTELMKQTDDRDRARLMKILINDMHPSPQWYSELDGFLSNYIASGSIASDDAVYYRFTLNLLQGIFQKEEINKLTGEYAVFKNELWRQFDVFHSYTEAPDYYLKALFAIAYFKNQEFGVAKTLSDYAISKNPNYILPYQIKSYVGLLTHEYDITLSALDVLLQVDSDNQERYQFLLGLVYYDKKEYTQATNYFLQTKSPRLKLEGRRYLIDMEKHNVNDRTASDKKIYGYLEQLFVSEHTGRLVDVDFQTVFDRYVYDRLQVGSGDMLAIKQLYTQYPQVYDFALQRCPIVLSGQQFICRYGEAGKLLIQGNTTQAIKLLIPLVKKYPQWQTYYIIGLLYKEQGLLDNAKVYFAKALQYIDSPIQKKTLSEMTVNLLNSAVP